MSQLDSDYFDNELIIAENNLKYVNFNNKTVRILDNNWEAKRG